MRKSGVKKVFSHVGQQPCLVSTAVCPVQALPRWHLADPYAFSRVSAPPVRLANSCYLPRHAQSRFDPLAYLTGGRCSTTTPNRRPPLAAPLLPALVSMWIVLSLRWKGFLGRLGMFCRGGWLGCPYPSIFRNQVFLGAIGQPPLETDLRGQFQN
jgi:hypothetical protein